jgi:hypothetical protein
MAFAKFNYTASPSLWNFPACFYWAYSFEVVTWTISLGFQQNILDMFGVRECHLEMAFLVLTQA